MGRKDCKFQRCPHPFCSGHGYCMPNGNCHCNPEFIGSGCEYHAYCGSFCNSQGACRPKLLDPTTPWVPTLAGTCDCHEPFNGTTCRIALRNQATRPIHSHTFVV